MYTYDHKHKIFAQALRKEQTPAEDIVWDALRGRKYKKLKFRRQHNLLNYVVDFYCHRVKLIIEVDGGIHEQQKEYDEFRQMLIESKGYQFIRISNRVAEKELESLLAKIDQFIMTLPQAVQKAFS